MKMKKKIIAYAMYLILACSLLCGCHAQNETANTINFQDTALSGTVTSINDRQITLSLSAGRDRQMPEKTAPGNTDQSSASDSSSTPPDMPSDNGSAPPDMPSDSSTTPPDMPSDSNTTPPNMPSTTFTLTINDESVLQDITLSEITAGTLLTVSFGSDGTITSITTAGNAEHGGNMDSEGGGQTPPGNDKSSADTGSGATTITEDTEESDMSYNSENSDENALRIEGSVSYNGTNLSVEKSSGDTSNTESSDFYGLNAGVLFLDGADAVLKDSVINTDAQGANGIFAYGSDTHVTVSNSSISTSADNSGGIDVTGGAILDATNLNIETNGQSSAAIRSDRGGGTLTVSQGSYTTHGTGSPAVYCTADIRVSDAVLTATASEGIVIEGKNSVTLENCDVTGNMKGTYQGDESENLHTIMIYQSMSGDADEGEANFAMKGGSITGQNGDLIYSTNTDSSVTLENVSLTLANDVLLRAAGNNSSRGWGKSGSNGADMNLTAVRQQLDGKIIVDEISSLQLDLSDESSFEGSINEEQESGHVSVTLDENSTWKLTADSYISSFEGSLENVDANGYTLYIDGNPQEFPK